MLAAIKLISTGASTVGTFKSLVDACSQSIFFTSEDDDIYEIYWKKGGWFRSCITADAVAPKASSSPVSYITSSGLEYVYYCSKEHHIIQLFRNSSISDKWQVTNLSTLLNVEVEPEGNLLCWTLLGTEHVYFNSKTGHIHEFYRLTNLPWIPGSGWKYNNLSEKAFAPLAETTEEPTVPDSIPDPHPVTDTFLDDFVQYPPLHPKFSDNVKYYYENSKSEAARRMKQSYENLLMQEDVLYKSIQEAGEGNEESKEALKKVKESKKQVEDNIRRELKGERHVTGGIGGNCSTFGSSSLVGGTQFIFYVGKEGNIYMTRWGTGFWSGKREEDIHAQQKKEADSSWFGVTKSLAWNTYGYVSSNLSASVPCWSTMNLSECYLHHTSIVPVGSPISHCTSVGSQHVFFIGFPKYNIHEIYWSPTASKWQHQNLSVMRGLPPTNPTGRIVSISSTLHHFLYFIDEAGNINELRQQLWKSDANWMVTNVRHVDPSIPPAQKLLAAADLPVNKNYNANVIYYLDKSSHLIELSCQWELTPPFDAHWNCVDLSVEKRLIGLPPPRGTVSVYSTGLIEALSTTTQSSIYGLISYFKSFGQPATITEDNEEDEKTEDTIVQEKLKIYHQKVLEEKEANEQLRALVAQLQENAIKQQEHAKLQEEQQEMIEKLRLENEAQKGDKGMLQEKLAEEMEKRRLQEEQAFRLAEEREKIAKQMSALQNEVNVLMNGMGYPPLVEMKKDAIETNQEETNSGKQNIQNTNYAKLPPPPKTSGWIKGDISAYKLDSTRTPTNAEPVPQVSGTGVATVQFDFTAGTEDELTVKANDRVYIYNRFEDWIECQFVAGGRSGWVPANYLKIDENFRPPS